MALRERIVLSCADGLENKAVAMQLRVTQQTVSKWRGRFVIDRLDGLLDTPCPCAPRTIADAQVSAVIAKTLESVPAVIAHWKGHGNHRSNHAVRQSGRSTTRCSDWGVGGALGTSLAS